MESINCYIVEFLAKIYSTFIYSLFYSNSSLKELYVLSRLVLYINDLHKTKYIPKEFVYIQSIYPTKMCIKTAP